MNLPFEKEETEWKPRAHIGRDDSLTPLERQILDTVDILEQRMDRTSRRSVIAYNLAVLEGFVLLYLVMGQDVGKILRQWLLGG